MQEEEDTCSGVCKKVEETFNRGLQMSATGASGCSEEMAKTSAL